MEWLSAALRRTWWDRLFGTFRDTDAFAARCGFGDGQEPRIGEMLVFHDIQRPAPTAGN